MGHSCGEHHGHDHGSSKNITAAFWLNVSFTVLEIIGGLYTNSVAILSDAVHDLGDSVSLLFSMIMEKKSRKTGDRILTYGYKRFSVLGALFSALVLLTGSTFIIYNAVNRLFNAQEVHVPGMILMAVIGILFNGTAVLRLRGDNGLNAKVVYMHLLEDVLGWLSILIVSIIMMFADLPVLDPVLSIAISVFVLSRIVPMFMKISRIFLQYKPDDIEILEIKSKIERVPKVEEIHDIHLWSLDGSNHVFSCHVVFAIETDFAGITASIGEIRRLLRESGISHSTLEPEVSGMACESCN